MASGHEQRNINWSLERLVWDFNYSVLTAEQFKALLEFFRARRGRGYGFRFKDWSDYKWSDESIGVGDGTNTVFQMTRVYESAGPNPYIRIISRPISGTIVVKVNAITKVETTDYTIDYSTGIITFGAGDIPAGGEIVSITGEFDVPVRFVEDRMSVQLEWEELGDVPSVSIIELRGT
jgi:uncharacterized protein (TIGR02217 family)